MSGDNKVWIVDMDNTKERTVTEATSYQKNGYNQFMSDSNKRKTLKYNDGVYVFTIHPFYGNSSFCIYINASGVGRVLSSNEEALKGYVNATNQMAANQKAANKNAAIKKASNKNAAIKKASNQNAAIKKAPLSPADTVFIAIDETAHPGSKQIKPAEEYQSEAYHAFMNGPKTEDLHGNKDGFEFSIRAFPSNGTDYSSFCIFVNHEGQESIMTNGGEGNVNKQKLSDYFVAQNLKGKPHLARMGNFFGGNRTKLSKKTKRATRSKRVHTAKRK